MLTQEITCEVFYQKDRAGATGRGFAGYCLEGIAILLDPRGDPQHLELQWFTVALQSQN